MTWYPPLKSCTSAIAIWAFHMSPPTGADPDAAAINTLFFLSLSLSQTSAQTERVHGGWVVKKGNRECKALRQTIECLQIQMLLAQRETRLISLKKKIQ